MIEIITLDNCSKWDELVKSFSNYDIYYLSGYVKAFYLNGDGNPILIHYEGDNTRAINVVMKRDISKIFSKNDDIEPETFFDLVTPYGYGGFIIEGCDTDNLFKEYEQFCSDNNIVSEFVRFHPQLFNWIPVSTLYNEIHLGETVYMDTSSEDIIWANITSKNRNVIRKAQNNGLTVHWGRNDEIIDPFMEIYNATMTKDDAEEYYFFKRPFYESIRNDLPENALWGWVEKDGVIAAISIFLFSNERMHYHLSASRREYQTMAPTNLLLYEAALWACKNGYKTLHMGGGVGSGHDSLYKFKKAFNRGDDLEFHIGKRIYDKEMYKKLCDLKNIPYTEETLSDGYFPKYRLNDH